MNLIPNNEMVSYTVGIGIREFSSVAEADRYYHAILHRINPGNEVPFKEAKEVLSLALYDGTNNFLLGKRFSNVTSVKVTANRFGNKVFCILLESGRFITLSLSRIFAAISRNAAKAFRKKANQTSGKICGKKKKKRIPPSPAEISIRHRSQFRRACRRLVYFSPEKPRLEGLEAHHANPGGLAFIINSFIVLKNVEFREKIASKGIILDETLRELFRTFHKQKVMWEMVDHETHLLIHQEKQPEKEEV